MKSNRPIDSRVERASCARGHITTLARGRPPSRSALASCRRLFRGDEAYYPTVPRDSRVEEGHERQRGDEVDDDDVDSIYDVDARQWLAQGTPEMSRNIHDVDARQRPALEVKIVAPESTPVVTGSAKNIVVARQNWRTLSQRSEYQLCGCKPATEVEILWRENRRGWKPEVENAIVETGVRLPG